MPARPPQSPQRQPHKAPMTDAPKPYCLIIPAFGEHTALPDQYVKKLAGTSLMQRALDTAGKAVDSKDIRVMTDSDEAGLICRRNNILCTVLDAHMPFEQKRQAVLELMRSSADDYAGFILFRATSPLLLGADIRDACALFSQSGCHCLVSTRLSGPRISVGTKPDINRLLFPPAEASVPVETRTLCILSAQALDLPGKDLKILPWPVLRERSIEITSHLDWWVCEKLLLSKHVVFVVAGYAAIGMGHIYRTLMLAQEIDDHRITFLCTRESGLAAARIAGRNYRTRIQGEESLADAVLHLAPDLIVNDILDTSQDYMAALKKTGVPVVNFEDKGPGADLADLVVNALYPPGNAGKRVLSGHRYFCLRDEFLNARQNAFRPKARRLLITFGGTDPSDYTRQVLDAALPLCRAHGVAIDIVTGPGYPHIKELEAGIRSLNAAPENKDIPSISFTHATNVMSQVMEGVDLAVSSAGRTVYELAHMRIPSVILSHNSREYMHTFARPARGFIHLGAVPLAGMPKVAEALARLLEPEYRLEMYRRMERLDFTPNKARVMKRILSLLNEREKKQ